MLYNVPAPSSHPMGGTGSTLTIEADSPETAVRAALLDYGREWPVWRGGCGYSRRPATINALEFRGQVPGIWSNQPDRWIADVTDYYGDRWNAEVGNPLPVPANHDGQPFDLVREVDQRI